MLRMSKAPLNAGQVRSYHEREFVNSEQRYYSQDNTVRGEWQGKLAVDWGLRGGVRDDHFYRLAEGEHPVTGEQLVRHRLATEYKNQQGETVQSAEHRAGWDATFNAPKSVSITALVGGDALVREAHRESVRVALDELEGYVQVRIGGNHPAETTGKMIAAKFEHDNARPVDGYAAPHLHTHVVIFNITESQDGKAHALQPRELYRSQRYARGHDRNSVMKRAFNRLRLPALTQNRSQVPHSLKNSDDFQRTRLRIVDDDVVRVAANRPKAKRPIRQIRADVTAQGPVRQESASLVDGRFDPVSGLYAVLCNVVPDFKKVGSRLWSEAV